MTSDRMKRDRDKFARRLDRLLDRYEDRLPPSEIEAVLQYAAQHQREESAGAIGADELDGWSE